jgi:hypothetical protein
MLYFSMLILVNSSSVPNSALPHLFDSYQSTYTREIGWKIETEYQKKMNKILVRNRQDRQDKKTRVSTVSNLSEAKVARQARMLMDEAIQKELKQERHK